MSLSNGQKGILALVVGCLIIYLGDHLLGVRAELYWGLATFSGLWTLDIFVVPLISGTVVSLIYGMGGKWLSHLPPLIVKFYGYYESLNLIGIPQGAKLMPMGWWGFSVILVVECSAVGGVVGELLVKRTYGRRPIHVELQEKAAPAEHKAQSDD